MIDERNTENEVPRMDAPEVMMPQESRAEVERFWNFMQETRSAGAAEQWAMKVFLQGMEFQRALTAAGAAVAGV